MRSIRCAAVNLFAATLALFAADTLVAGEFTIATSDGGGQVGGFYGPYLPSDDEPASFSVPPPDNDASFQNYFLGRTTVSGFTTPERRAFFLFDMAGAGASIPSGETVTDVSISLILPFGGVDANFATDDKEIVEFTGTPADAAAILDPVSAGVAPEEIWDTFGFSTPYGGFEIFGPASSTPTTDGVKEIPLPGAIDDVKAAIAGGGIFVVTARLDTYDPGPIGADAPPADDEFEFVFGLTDVVGGGGLTIDPPELTITTAVPEPSTFALISLAALGLALLWRRRRR